MTLPQSTADPGGAPVLRDAVPADAAGIAVIYNDAVRNTAAIWNDKTVDAADRVAWMTARHSAGFPVLVAEDADGVVVGYASFGAFRAFDGYRHTVEHSIYVRADQRGRGLGESLLRALIARAQDAGIHVIVGAIEAGNAASLALHDKLGFTRVGTMPQVGTKFGRWLDLALVQLTLDDRPNP